MRPLGKAWPRLQRQVQSARHVCLLLDYDGTLVALAEHPARALLPAKTKQLLEQLAHQRGVRVVVISGRRLGDLKQMVGLRGVWYVGNHGLEAQGGGLRYLNPVAQATRPVLREVVRRLQGAVRQIPGAWVEDKRLTASLHWRAVPRSAHRLLHRLVTQCLAPYVKEQRITMTQGKQVVEIRPPVQWGKGEMVDWLRGRLTSPPPRQHLWGGGSRRAPARALLIYLGDDQTDEDAFRVVNRLGGLSVFVGQSVRRTAARYGLKDSAAVCAWLRWLGQTWQQTETHHRRWAHGLVTASA